MKLFLELPSLKELPAVSRQVIQLAQGKRIFAFHGEMGAGKTTLIKAICAELGVADAVSSPTFSIVNEYHTADSKRLFHFDFYRIKTETEAYDMGYEEYFYSGAYCFVEWPEMIPSLLPENTVHITITKQGEQRLLAVEI